jgi:hypothetical protein
MNYFQRAALGAVRPANASLFCHLSLSVCLSLMLVLPVDADDIILFALLTPLSSISLSVH